ncbi:S-adenosyl-L-methionine-dependent tRNA 4-demethylwyosine synthase TYW1-like isoform X2 [Paramacrobiotus metropolitanus]|uniref:S-adenosyl-L-methionine-dependent tRNA 4-demethylwyosine synthase TYW1-like isoform X2 n=1 Tax=Paramacrobiotus metropolitanus TaxID=2943436 RepID=UPI0024456BE1|nr:S-adenosyl-L-methionine-dependent tRNA 4-demethylwyosine synthase TYW1-like isoform X2 [Paramacrobiotus metropolitanus]
MERKSSQRRRFITDPKVEQLKYAGKCSFHERRVYHKFAQELAGAVNEHVSNRKCEILDLSTWDPEKFLNELSADVAHVFILSTWTDGEPPPSAKWFALWLKDTVDDFRVSKSYLKDMKFAVFGLGNSSYGKNYNKVAKSVYADLLNLSAAPISSLGLGDEDVVSSKYGGMHEDFRQWMTTFLRRLDGSDSGGDNDSESLIDDNELFETTSEEEENGYESGDGKVMDLEDLGNVADKISSAKKTRVLENGRAKVRRIRKNDDSNVAKEMVTPELRAALSKQGYRIVGSHSGVKLCRWTKSMLRGRGGCYKHTFYGIESHRCMEATPSLACANKCVFCWRHHTNPVGTEWRWKMDPPEQIFSEALDNHMQMIKQFKGVPGVKTERFNEGLEPRHCALSLVGEPIMYPAINELVRMLHARKISTFLVTNAQFPDAIRALSPVTQLYVSIDASNKESLKKIDRPLFGDFWERYIDSLKALSEKGQRTVYRLTLVKSFNVSEIEGYAKLVDLGKPDFIEIKGVTYCGDAKGGLTMENVPWHEEVMSFVKKMEELLPNYEIASEHEHSNCLLLADKKFKVNGEWWTWIDYDKFHELVQEYQKHGKTFRSENYMAKTPYWAVYGCKERGFDPEEVRFFRKNRKDVSGC